MRRLVAAILIGLGLGVMVGAASASGAVTSLTPARAEATARCDGHGCQPTEGDRTGGPATASGAPAHPAAAVGDSTATAGSAPATIAGGPTTTGPSSENNLRAPIDRDAFIVLAVFASVIAAALAGLTFVDPRWTDA